GGNAQTKPMKKVSGTLKLDQAQYRELEAFAKFGSDLDAATMAVIGQGERNVEILKQTVNSPIPVEEQVAIIYAGTHGLLRNIPVAKVKEWQENFLSLMRSKHADLLTQLRNGKYDDAIVDQLKSIITDSVAQYAN